MMDDDLKKRRQFFIKEMYKGTVIMGLLYLFTVYVIFDLETSIYLTIFNFVVGFLFVKPVTDSAFEKNIGKIQFYSILNTLIILISTAVLLFYYSFPILDIALFSLIVIFIISALFHSNVAHTINLTKGYIDIANIENNPVSYVATSLSVWQFMQIPIFTGLIWLVLDDISHSLLIGILLYSISLLFNRKRAILIVNEEKKTHSLFLFLIDTIVILVALILIYYFNKESLIDKRFYVLFASIFYYLMKTDSVEFFTGKNDSNDT